MNEWMTLLFLYLQADTSLVAQMVKNLPDNTGNVGSIPGLVRFPEEEMATHSNILAWEIPWTEEPDGLQYMGSQRVRHDWATELTELTPVTPWTVACQGPLFIGFSRQKYWSGLSFPSPGDLPNPAIEPWSPALQADSLLTELRRKVCNVMSYFSYNLIFVYTYMKNEKRFLNISYLLW